MQMMMEGAARLSGALNEVIWGPLMLLAFLATGLRFSIHSRWFQFRKFGHWMQHTFISLFTQKQVRQSQDKGAISQFQAMATAMAATAGTGNIAGVASAIAIGGPGAVFWMWVSAFLGMMTSYVENALGIQYRYRGADGQWVGGAMIYMERGMKAKGLALFFAFSCALASMGIGNMTQINSMAVVLEDSFGISPLVCGLVAAGLVGLVIIGGLHRVASVTERIVPLMVIFYTGGMILCLVTHAPQIPGALGLILSSAFQPVSAAGGVVGYGLMKAVRMGISRGVFSNEAGLGSTVMVHTASDAKSPKEQGMWGIFEVFADTIVMCTLTALVILTSGVYNPGEYLQRLSMGQSVVEGAVLTTDAIAVTLGSGGQIFTAVALTLFAFATILGWSTYGEKAFVYLTGGRGRLAYRLVFTGMVLVGAVGGLTSVWEISDLFNGLMAVPNLLAIHILGGRVAKQLRKNEKNSVK